MQRIDVVIPVFNAQKHLSITLTELDQLSDLIENVILVDDASIDEGLKSLPHVSYKIVQIINESNIGQHASTRIGLLRSKTDWILTLDDDLPVSTIDLRNFIIQAIMENAEIIYANYYSGNLFRNLASKLHSRIISQIHQKKINHGTSTRLLKRVLIDKLRKNKKPETYLDNELIAKASSVGYIEVMPRITYNKSRYNWRRLFRTIFSAYFNR